MVQRLDRDTSGVIVFSIHPRAHGSLSVQFRDRLVRKFYLALVVGRPEPDHGQFLSRLVRNRRNNRIRSAADGGREAVTRYRVLQSVAGTSLVLIELITGRTHQIRVHFSEAGHPLVGDARYGGPMSHDGREFTRHCLHSWRIRLNHPYSGKAMELEASPPAAMAWSVVGPAGREIAAALELSS